MPTFIPNVGEDFDDHYNLSFVCEYQIHRGCETSKKQKILFLFLFLKVVIVGNYKAIKSNACEY